MSSVIYFKVEQKGSCLPWIRGYIVEVLHRLLYTLNVDLFVNLLMRKQTINYRKEIGYSHHITG